MSVFVNAVKSSPAVQAAAEAAFTTAHALRLCAFSAAFINYYKGYPDIEDNANHWSLLLLPLELAVGLLDRSLRLKNKRALVRDPEKQPLPFPGLSMSVQSVREVTAWATESGLRLPWIIARGFKSYALLLNWPRFIFRGLDITVEVRPGEWKEINYGALMTTATIPVVWDLSNLVRGKYTEDASKQDILTKIFRGFRDMNVFLNSIFYFAEFCNYPIVNLGHSAGATVVSSIFAGSFLLAALRAKYFPENENLVRQCLSGFTMFMSLRSAAQKLDDAAINSYLLGLQIVTLSFSFVSSNRDHRR